MDGNAGVAGICLTDGAGDCFGVDEAARTVSESRAPGRGERVGSTRRAVRSTFEHPSVLGQARPRALFPVGRSELRHVVGRYRVAMRLRIDAVHARGAEAEDLCLDLGCEWTMPESLHERLGHRESAKRLDLPLR